MDQDIINRIAFFSCLLGIVVGWILLRWAQRELLAMADERPRPMKQRAKLLGRRTHARALLVGGAVLFGLGIMGLFNLFFRQL